MRSSPPLEAFGKAASVCIGNRQCQKIEKGVMCPNFRATENEIHSTRNRAVALKAMLDGQYALSGPELEKAMDLCLGCKGCKRECPSGVDMALLSTEYLARRWRREGLPLRFRLFGSLLRYVHHLRLVEFLHPFTELGMPVIGLEP
ncbi:MAG TPA: (Fe-S)-binding protein [Burkholderiales bacterium]|nr:(Fe-S)-binding protein [Burkholderiales bacterium]